MLKLTTELLFFYFKNKYGQKICIIKHGNRQNYCNYERQEGRCTAHPATRAGCPAARSGELTAQRPPGQGSAQRSGPTKGAHGAAAAQYGERAA